MPEAVVGGGQRLSRCPTEGLAPTGLFDSAMRDKKNYRKFSYDDVLYMRSIWCSYLLRKELAGHVTQDMYQDI